ncbi:HNH endonuclease [Aeromonas taiwanensis]
MCSRPDRQFISDGTSRLCRFCEKDENKTTFSNESHAIPECLGNHQLILLDECDVCNKFFSEKLNN